MIKSIYNYFFLKNYRVKEYNYTYDFNMNPSDPIEIFTKYGWIYATNEVSKFKADIFVMRKLDSDLRYSLEKIR